MSNLSLQPERSKSDDETPDLFRCHWHIYRKVVENDYMFHKAAYGVLADVLASEIDGPFSFADLACGDAYSSSRCLASTTVEEYIGVDLSEWALELAEQELKKVNARRRLVCGRFQDIDRHLQFRPDIVWVGLSIHHLTTDEKRDFMGGVSRVLAPGGLFLIYEPTLAKEEKVENYAERFKKVAADGWVDLTAAELDAVCDHVRGCDMPELPDTWAQLGRDAGFDAVDRLYTDPTGLYSLFRYS